MQFTKFAVIASLAAAASAWSNETWVTTTVDTYTTVCPQATTLTHNGVTYTATAVSSALIKKRRRNWLTDLSTIVADHHHHQLPVHR
jgi:hypothetical protein